MRAALAEEPVDRLGTLRKRIAAAGIDPELFSQAILAFSAAESTEDVRAVLEQWMDRFLENYRFHALTALLEGSRIERVRHGHMFIAEADRPELRQAVEIRFLKGLAERYPKVVEGAGTFDWLSFSDPQLRDASRCYLYGFFRAAVLIAVAALQARLRVVSVGDAWMTYDALADLTFGNAGVCGADPARAAALKDLFRLRNDIAHASAEPIAEQAESALLLIRGTLDPLSKYDRGFSQSNR